MPNQSLTEKINALLFHYTDDYIDPISLIDLQHSVISVNDCPTCQNCRASNTMDDDMFDHLNDTMLFLQNLHKQLSARYHRDYHLDDIIIQDMLERKQSIINLLFSTNIDFKSRVKLENKIVEIDKRIAKSQGTITNYKNHILSILNIVKLEMFKLDDLMQFKLQQK